jgi:hypothetical protein
VKHWNDLTPEQQQAAVDKVLVQDLEAVVSGAVRFNDELNGDNLQATIDEALQEAEANRTPWFAHEYVMEARFKPMDGHITEDDGLWPVREYLEGMARCTAEDALYSEDNEYIINGVA